MEVMSLLDMMREDMKGEVDAIEMYEMHINSIKVNDVRALLQHIVEEERQHSHDLHQMIEKYEKMYKNVPQVDGLETENQD
jgi:rubrerythrin